MSKLQPVILVCATQSVADYFSRSTLLGRSLQAFPEAIRPSLLLLPSNSGPGAKGLPQFYNQAIDSVDENSIIVFLHDDVYLHDWHLTYQLNQALSSFDVIGVVGSANVPYGQPGWWHQLSDSGQPLRNDTVTRSGTINHFDSNLVRPDYFGSAPMACDLLDGVFLAVRRKTLLRTGLRFDTTFSFHCYDSDFCYSARRLGLRLGTWPISLTHGSPGSYSSSWIESAKLLKKKLTSMPALL